ncbi:glycosyltransferase [Gordonia sp. NPDC057258]|uniref:glycosyltransferase n=1 Tax=unclassified Gordonia (in: high G+C Gram-positive bacteria) TaxID=2657482 RepID=UPI003630EA50
MPTTDVDPPEDGLSTLSVVVPAFNEDLRIRGCLDRLVNQTRQIDEIIVVDNGSTDATPSIVDEFAEKYSNVTRLVEPEPGVIHARRSGFDAATSTLIAKTDADSRIREDWAERVVAFFDSDLGREFSGLTGLVLCWDAPARGFQRKLLTWNLGQLKRGGEIGSLNGINYVIRREAWYEVRDSLQTNPDSWEDLDLGLALSENNRKMYFDPDVHVDTSCRQLRHSPWANRVYISGGVRTAERRGNEAAVKALRFERPFRFVAFTVMWLMFRPWDPQKSNWRPHRLLTPLPRERALVTEARARPE